MKKIILLVSWNLLLSVPLFFIRCGVGGSNHDSSRPSINDVKKPCVVVAVKKRDDSRQLDGWTGSIILKGADGVYTTFESHTNEGAALVSSYNKGDTIK